MNLILYLGGGVNDPHLSAGGTTNECYFLDADGKLTKIPCGFDDPDQPCIGDPLPTTSIRKTGPDKPIGSGQFTVGENAVREIKKGVKKDHHGLDLACQEGDPIYSTLTGSLEVGYSIDQDSKQGLGIFVRITGTDGMGQPLIVGFAHLSSAIQNKTYVQVGDVIGYCGRTGYKGGDTHTHMEVGRVNIFLRNANSRANQLDPELFLTTKFNPQTGEMIQTENCQ